MKQFPSNPDSERFELLNYNNIKTYNRKFYLDNVKKTVICCGQ